ncbi:hypothetical protein Mmc1_2798 [Magnetococcus marinus MC-1]|uniref:Uncharacterized protein n=1 Tax=Magnetococcus marinus (strain ATCC BAA-1437 / JCM 17883 / MC-1) TaxID=156889 RepID=A0LBE8_MAGMM|nr:hypothetical protein [Magnetococcus marinus]ABK45291.1 hypothetical protein Mmc1_2798 [Magnetococcus marinus MC-1]
MSVISASLAIAEGDYAWTGTMELADPASFQRIRIDDPVTLELGGETFQMMVDNKTLSRDGVSRPRLTVSLISPTARFAAPRATPMERAWDAAIRAREAAEEAVGEAIQWDLVNWVIPAGRLAVYDAAPLDVVRTIAEAVGGVVETTPGGILRVRHRFPTAVPQWSRVTPDHILTDAADNLSCRESHRARYRVNRVTVRGWLPSGGHLSAEVDRRVDGLNQGRTSFHSGGTAHLLVNNGSETDIQGISASAGTLLTNADQSFTIAEDVTFDGTNSATLSQPARAIQSVIWLGNDLGAVTLAPDGMTLLASRAGIAIARITFTVRARSWRLSAPSRVAGLDSFPVQVRITGTSGDPVGDGEIICQRGDGEFPGEDISDPLLATTEAKLSRGRAEIDAGEDLQEVLLTCVHRPGVSPGQIIEIHDALMGRSWRGKVTGVAHEAIGPRITTSLEVARVPARS